MQCSREVFGEKSFEKLSTVVWYELFLLRTLDFIGRVFSVNTMGGRNNFWGLSASCFLFDIRLVSSV